MDEPGTRVVIVSGRALADLLPLLSFKRRPEIWGAHGWQRLLPETHIAVIPRSRIVTGMEDAWALLRRERGALPRAVNFISGPSRTADIEQTVVLGVHGPYRVHILLVHDQPGS